MVARRAGLLLLLLASCRRDTTCKEPAVSGLTIWDAEVSKDGSEFSTEMGSVLVQRGDGYVAHVRFALVGPKSYGTINVPLRNHREDPAHPTTSLAVDLGASHTVTVRYASTANSFLQLRHGARSHGGHHYRAKLPDTAGELRNITLRFADFAQPDWVEPADRYPLDLHDVFSFTIAALESNDVTVSWLAVDGFTPRCD
jgi:hypothetical protein